jgi:hypothetical protein
MPFSVDDLADGLGGMVVWFLGMASGMPPWGALCLVVAFAGAWVWCKAVAQVRRGAHLVDTLPAVAPAALATFLASV